jgi:hypothetical protein
MKFFFSEFFLYEILDEANQAEFANSLTQTWNPE